MDSKDFISQWIGEEILAFASSSIKYRGVLKDVLDGGYLVMEKVAVMNPVVNEMSEYETCIINLSEISGVSRQEIVGRGREEG
ncbi:MAG: hypothetical protein PHO53_05095 [Actinomycetota bacterium]|nr:hypothetical protein [Actinomycetota bacterium]